MSWLFIGGALSAAGLVVALVNLYFARTVIQPGKIWITPAGGWPEERDGSPPAGDAFDLMIPLTAVPPGNWQLRQCDCIVRRGMYWPWRRDVIPAELVGDEMPLDGTGPTRFLLRYRFRNPSTPMVRMKLTVRLDPRGRKSLRRWVDMPTPDEFAS